jgi:glucokinase
MINKAVDDYVMPDCAKYTDIVGASLGNKAGCLGAASLVFTSINNNG